MESGRFIKSPEKFARTSAWEKLRSQCLQSSAAQRLWRKSQTLTNAKDHVRYQHSASGESKLAEAWWKSPVEQAPEFYPVDDPDALDLGQILEQDDLKEREAIQKLHQQNLGHPTSASLARTLRIGGAPDRLWKWVKHSFRCPACSSEFLPKPARPAAVPKRYTCCRCPNPRRCGWHLCEAGLFLGFLQVLLLDQGTEFLGGIPGQGQSVRHSDPHNRCQSAAPKRPV